MHSRRTQRDPFERDASMSTAAVSENSETRFIMADGLRPIPIAYPPAQAAIASGRTRTRIFGAIRSGELKARKDGKATLIEHEELIRWVRSLPVVQAKAS
jgi:hypothetical protein